MMIVKACYAFDTSGYVYYDWRNDRYGECLRYLELNNYLISTEIGEFTIAYKIDHKTAWWSDIGYYCWCHLHVEGKDE